MYYELIDLKFKFVCRIIPELDENGNSKEFMPKISIIKETRLISIVTVMDHFVDSKFPTNIMGKREYI